MMMFIGYGRDLMVRITEAMKEEGITKLGLVCFAENTQGNEFWKRLGSINDQNC